MYGAFFESAPAPVLQIAIISKGLLKQDIYSILFWDGVWIALLVFLAWMQF